MSEYNDIEIVKCSTDWTYEPLSNYIELITYGFTNPMPTTEYGPYMITAKDINNGRILYESARRTSQEAYDNDLTDKSRPQINDVLITKDGSIGRVAIVDKNNICINQSVARLTPNNRIRPRYLKYLLETPIYQRQISIDADGSTIKHIYITRIDKMKIAVPEISEQDYILAILESIDLKVELLNQQSETLESISQALFKHWLVVFEFPDEHGKPYRSSGGRMVPNEEYGEIPERWDVRPLDEIADFLNGLPMQNYPPYDPDVFLPVIKIRELINGITDVTDKASPDIDSRFIVDYGEVILSWSGTLELVLWNHGKGALNQHLFKVSSKEYPKWFYYYWIKRYLRFFRQIANSKATTMGHIQRHHLSESMCFIPTNDQVPYFDKILMPMLDKVINNFKTVEILKNIRDLILPKLISGQIRVTS